MLHDVKHVIKMRCLSRVYRTSDVTERINTWELRGHVHELFHFQNACLGVRGFLFAVTLDFDCCLEGLQTGVETVTVLPFAYSLCVLKRCECVLILRVSAIEQLTACIIANYVRRYFKPDVMLRLF